MIVDSSAIVAILNREREAERFEREIREIREEARRAGVPPGWLRR